MAYRFNSISVFIDPDNQRSIMVFNFAWFWAHLNLFNKTMGNTKLTASSHLFGLCCDKLIWTFLIRNPKWTGNSIQAIDSHAKTQSYWQRAMFDILIIVEGGNSTVEHGLPWADAKFGANVTILAKIRCYVFHNLSYL